MASACSRVGSEARTSTWRPGTPCHPPRRPWPCSLSLPLANSLIRRPAAPGSSVENAYSSGPISASLTTSNSVPADGARRQRVLDNFQEHAGFTSLLAHRGHLADRGARVLGCDQGVGLRGDFCQLGDYFLLLGQIESHCTPPIELRSRLLPLAVLGGAVPWRRGRSRIPVVALPEFPEGAAPSTQACSSRSWIKRSRLQRRRFLASTSSLPVVVTR